MPDMTLEERFLQAVADIKAGRCPTCHTTLVPQGQVMADCPTCQVAWGLDALKAPIPVIVQRVGAESYSWTPSGMGYRSTTVFIGDDAHGDSETILPTWRLVPFLFENPLRELYDGMAKKGQYDRLHAEVLAHRAALYDRLTKEGTEDQR